MCPDMNLRLKSWPSCQLIMCLFSAVEFHLDISKHFKVKCPVSDVCMCVCPAAAGCLGSRRDWWHLCGCQQQVQTDGLWLCQVRICNYPSVCIFAVQWWEENFGVRLFASVCYRDWLLSMWCVSSVRICQFVFAKAYLVCACAICQVGRNFSSSLLPAILLHLFLQVFLCFVP